MTQETLQGHLDALLISGEVEGTPGALELWAEIKARHPLAWREMVNRLADTVHRAPRHRRTLTWTLIEQSDRIWVGALNVLPEDLGRRVQALCDAEEPQTALELFTGEWA